MSDQRPNFWEYWGKFCPKCVHSSKDISEDPCYSCGPSSFPEMTVDSDGYFRELKADELGPPRHYIKVL